MEQEEIDKQWPGFTVTCKNCQSTQVELDNSIGYSAQSGGWGALELKCLDCGTTASLMEGS